MNSRGDDAEVLEDTANERWYVPHDGDPGRFVGADGRPALHLIVYQDVLRLCEDTTGLLIGPTDRRLPKAGIYVSNLRGTAYHQRACRAGDFSPGARLRLVPEPGNPHDRHAVAVYDVTGQHLAAYVNKQKARLIAQLLAAGTELEIISLRGTAAGRGCDQVAILAAAPAIVARLLQPRPSNLPIPAHLR